MAPISFPLRRAQFDALANGWHMLGATDVSLWSPDGTLGYSSSHTVPQSYDLAAPIRIGGRTIGEVRIAGVQDTNTQTQLAQQAELIAQLTLLETDLEQARKMQAGLLPAGIPTIEGLEIFAELRSAAHVGGDYYDFLTHSSEGFTFAIGDVCNKGVSAALVMAVLRKVLRTSVKSLAKPLPSAILAYTNLDMYDELSSASMFATSIVGHFNVASRVLRYANAGHSPVIYCPVDGQARILRADNVPLGVLPGSTFIEQELQIGVGDLLVVATDGIVELRDHFGQAFGHKRLMNLIEQKRHHSAKHIAEDLFATIENFTDSPIQEDDQAVLVIRGVA